MEKFKLFLLRITLLLVICLAQRVTVASAQTTAPVFSPEDVRVYGKQLVVHSDNVLHGWKDEVVSGEMRLYDASRRSTLRAFRRISLERFGKGDKSIIKFTAPADIKGVSALNYENSGSIDDNWLYLPAIKKVRRISGANNTASFQGSEFTYEDLNDLDPDEYEWRFVEEAAIEINNELTDVFKIEAKPTYRDTAYSRLVLYLSKDYWYQTKVEYFDKSGTHLKTKIASRWQQFHGRFWRPLQVDMSNHLTGKKTILSFNHYYVDLSQYVSKKTGEKRKNLKEDLFTKRALVK
ncbi:outer membrane lipoprotein-sorting protein [Exilibacterium tricleocarpae]|nr:outer membrane lipoprotein-sorting protein [Exilibacterium tricleocarpae]